MSDEYVKICDDLILLGREDISAGSARRSWDRLENPYEGESSWMIPLRTEEHCEWDLVTLNP